MVSISNRKSTFLHRLIGALALRAETYEEVEADPGANGQAVAVVVLSSVAAGLGAQGLGAVSAGDVAFFAIVALLAWAAWALVVFEIGARILPGAADACRYRSTPADDRLCDRAGICCASPASWPELTIPSFTVAALWMLLAMIVAVRQALDYTSTRRAIAVCGLGWVLAIALAVLFGIWFGPRVS